MNHHTKAKDPAGSGEIVMKLREIPLDHALREAKARGEREAVARSAAASLGAS